MTNAVISYDNLIFSETLTVTTVDPSFPVSYLTDHYSPAYTYRTTDVNTQDITVNTSGTVLTRVYLYNTNLTAGATVELKGSDDNFATAPGYTGALTRAGNWWYLISTGGETFNDWRLSIDDPGNTDGYIEIGVYYFSRSQLIPAYGFDDTVQINRVDPSINSMSNGGQMYTVEKNRYRTVSLPLQLLVEADGYEDFIDAVGKRVPVVLAMMPPGKTVFTEVDKFTMYMRLNSWENRYPVGVSPSQIATLDLREEL